MKRQPLSANAKRIEWALRDMPADMSPDLKYVFEMARKAVQFESQGACFTCMDVGGVYIEPPDGESPKLTPCPDCGRNGDD